MSPREAFALRDYLGADLKGRTISDARQVVSLTDILGETCLADRLGELSGRSVLLAVADQLISGIVMTELDGVARRMLLCPPDLNAGYLQALMEDAGIDAVVTDHPARWADAGTQLIVTAGAPGHAAAKAQTERATEWLMLTSGTSGVPKIVSHTLEGLTGAIVADSPARSGPAVWATFYDIRRYGGLQIFLRAIIGGGSMVLSEPGEPLADYIARLRAAGVTQISGTPSHWRKLLMSGSVAGFSPRYVRLSGEIADQAVLDGLSRAFPEASIGHAYASTEAGVGFAVNDGLEGFPATMIGDNRDGVEMKVEDGSLADSFDANRPCLCRPKRSGAGRCSKDSSIPATWSNCAETDTISSGGAAASSISAASRFIRKKSKPSSTGMPRSECRAPNRGAARSPAPSWSPMSFWPKAADASRSDEIRDQILADCRASLPSYKVPAVIRFVRSLDITAAGKLARHDA